MQGDESGLGDTDSSVGVGDSDGENESPDTSTDSEEIQPGDMESDRVNRRNVLLTRVMARPNVTIRIAITVSWSQWSGAHDEYEYIPWYDGPSDEDRWEGDLSGGYSHNEISMFSMFMIFLCFCVLDTIV